MAVRRSGPRSDSGKAREAPPPVQLADLERALAQDGPLARGYLVRGDEPWFRDRAVDALVRAASSRGLEIARHDVADPDFDLAGLLADLGAPPLFAPERLVLVRGVASMLRREGAGAEPPLVTAAATFLATRSVPGTLVLEGEPIRADHALATAVRAQGGTVLGLRRLYDTPPPWGRDADLRRTELALWILARAREKGVRLGPDDAAHLAAATGNDLGALEADLDHLAREGTRDVRRSVGWTAAVSPFQLAEDLLRGETGAALAGIETLFRSGVRVRDGSREVKPEAALAVLLGALRGKLREAHSVARGGEPPANPRFREEAVARARLRPVESWHAMLADLADLERRTRTSRTVDADDLARLALRWRREDARIVAAERDRRDRRRG